MILWLFSGGDYVPIDKEISPETDPFTQGKISIPPSRFVDNSNPLLTVVSTRFFGLYRLFVLSTWCVFFSFSNGFKPDSKETPCTK